MGLDLNPVTINGPKERIFVYQGAQEDTLFSLESHRNGLLAGLTS